MEQIEDIMTRISALTLTIIAALVVVGCTDQGTGPAASSPPTSNTYDPGPQSFSGDIHPILLANCAVSGCHMPPALAGGFNQTTYAGVRAGGTKYGTNVIIPGDSTNSGIIKTLRGTGLVARMPIGGTYASTGLPDTMIVKIGAWIMQGAANN